MIRNLLATTAIAAFLAAPALAQDATAPAAAPAATTTQQDPAAQVKRADGNLASNVIGETVYNGTGDQAENIGEVNDIVIGPNGGVQALIVGVGGFLGLGEKNVAIEYKNAQWAEKDGDRWLVVAMTKEQLESQPAFDTAAYEPAPATATTAAAPVAPAADQTAAAPAEGTVAAPADTTAMAPADGTAPAPAETTAMAPATTDQNAMAPATTDQNAMAPANTDQNAMASGNAAGTAATDNAQTAAIDRSTLTEMPAGDIRAEELVGTTVYGAQDANVGEIGDVVLNTDGKIDAVIIDVGGFLGIGEKEVAVGMDKLSFMTDKDGNKYLYTNFTQEQLEGAAAYDKSTWAEQRDQQRVLVQ